LPPPAGRIPSIALLSAISTAGPLAINIIIPSLPGIAGALGTSYASAQLLVTVYLVAFAVFHLFVGPLSDRVGRRVSLQLGLGVFALASAYGLVADSIGLLLIARLGQAFGACTLMLVPRAIIRDSRDDTKAVRDMALIAMVMSAAPALAPLIGGVGETLVSWRFGFGFCAAIGVAMFFWLWRALSETRVVPAAGYPAVGELLRRYRALLANRSFLGYSLALAFLSSCFYGFSVGAPALFAYRYGITPPQFGIAMFCISLGFVVGSFVAARAARYLTLNRMLVLGSCGIATTMALLTLGAWVDSFYYYIAIMIAYALANGFVYPTSISGAISVDPGIAGAASAFMGFAQQAICAIVTLAVGAVAGPDPIAFLSITLLAGLLCPASLLLIARPGRS